jgi:hypothetical protein
MKKHWLKALLGGNNGRSLKRKATLRKEEPVIRDQFDRKYYLATRIDLPMSARERDTTTAEHFTI